MPPTDPTFYRSPAEAMAAPPERLDRKAGYSRPHTVHCGPGGIFMSALGGANGNDGPGGVALLDHDSFQVIGAWELDRGAQYFAYDVWWHLNHDTLVTSEFAARRCSSGGLSMDPGFFPRGDDFRGLRLHQTRLQGGDASSDSYCHTR
jgi:56kDa selenium binding protein (SBP56)